MDTLRITSLAVAIAASLWAADALAQQGVPTNPYSPARDHPYRHGVIPTLDVHAAMQRWARAHRQTTDSPTLSYNGGTGNAAVMSGPNKVYLVFYGSQWGAASTDVNGNLVLSSDVAGAAGATQQMFKGIGTNSETWQADLTQWCDGAGEANGATSCPATGVNHVPYQANMLAGVWYDASQLSPATASFTDLANEASAAAAHFGNTTAASNRYAYYVVLSPTGTNPDNYIGQFCAWHSSTSSPYGVLAFSNQPYNIDAGPGCGTNFINSGTAGLLDGWTMTLGHEWHEMASDMYPNTGWQNTNAGTYAGQENSDECAWIPHGSPGGAANVTFGTGTFAEQASWSNDTNECSMTHAVLYFGPTQLVKNPAFENATAWSATPGVMCNTGCAGQTPFGGVGFAWLDGIGSVHTDRLSQTITIPAGRASATLKYFLHIDTLEPTKAIKDKLFVMIYSGSTLLQQLHLYSNADQKAGYTQHTHDLSAYIGQTITVRFTGTEDAQNRTSFVLDNVTVTVQ